MVGPNMRATNSRWRIAAILKKKCYLSKCFTDQREIWHSDALTHIETRVVSAVKISNFGKSKMADVRHLEKSKNGHLWNVQHEIWHGDEYWPSAPSRLSKFRILRNSRWRTVALFKNRTSPYLSNCLTPIDIKFGKVTYIDPPNRINS